MLFEAFEGLLGQILPVQPSQHLTQETGAESRMLFLVEETKRGNEDAFAELYDIISPALIRYITTRITEKDVEDLASEVFVKIWEKMKSFYGSSEGEFRSWMYTIAQRSIIDFYRGRKELASLEEGFDIISHHRHDSPEACAELTFAEEQLSEALLKLPKETREVVSLYYLHGYSYSEIAEITNKKEDTVRVTAHRGIQRLRELLPEEEVL